ncbi:MAG: KTSC domain-containing protein [Orrella sp.]
MLSKTFPSGRLRMASFEPKQQQLTLSWENKTVTSYRPVPEEIYQRLCRAPNPSTYVEDRIAEEYPKVHPPRPKGPSEAAKKLDDLFGN